MKAIWHNKLSQAHLVPSMLHSWNQLLLWWASIPFSVDFCAQFISVSSFISVPTWPTQSMLLWSLWKHFPGLWTSPVAFLAVRVLLARASLSRMPKELLRTLIATNRTQVGNQPKDWKAVWVVIVILWAWHHSCSGLVLFPWELAGLPQICHSSVGICPTKNSLKLQPCLALLTRSLVFSFVTHSFILWELVNLPREGTWLFSCFPHGAPHIGTLWLFCWLVDCFRRAWGNRSAGGGSWCHSDRGGRWGYHGWGGWNRLSGDCWAAWGAQFTRDAGREADHPAYTPIVVLNQTPNWCGWVSTLALCH